MTFLVSLFSLLRRTLFLKNHNFKHHGSHTHTLLRKYSITKKRFCCVTFNEYFSRCVHSVLSENVTIECNPSEWQETVEIVTLLELFHTLWALYFDNFVFLCSLWTHNFVGAYTFCGLKICSPDNTDLNFVKTTCSWLYSHNWWHSTMTTHHEKRPNDFAHLCWLIFFEHHTMKNSCCLMYMPLIFNIHRKFMLMHACMLLSWRKKKKSNMKKRKEKRERCLWIVWMIMNEYVAA